MFDCENIFFDYSRGEIICLDTGEVLAERIPATFLGIEETSPARDAERLEKLYENAETLRRRYRWSRSYRRVIRAIARNKNRKSFTQEQLKYIRMVIEGKLTTWDVAKTLNVSVKTVYNWLVKARKEGWI